MEDKKKPFETSGDDLESKALSKFFDGKIVIFDPMVGTAAPNAHLNKFICTNGTKTCDDATNNFICMTK